MDPFEQAADEEARAAGRHESRAFFRVEARLAARCKKLEAWELEAIRREISGLRDGPRLDIDPRLSAWLERIEHKLEILLAYVTERRQGAPARAEVHEVVISGSGVLLETRERVAIDEEVLVEIPIPGARVQPLRALARVVRMQPGKALSGGRGVALAFSTIDETDREAIVRFAHEVQRARLEAAGIGGESRA